MHRGRFLLQINILLLMIMSSSISVFADGFYKWRDSYGNIQYGDNPPKNVRLERLDMPQLTVIQDYGSQWKAEEVDINKLKGKKPSPPPITKQDNIHYERFTFIAPKINQVIHSKDGDISAMLSINPPLKPGHSILFVMDEKISKKGTSRITNFTGLSVGSHLLNAQIINAQGKPIQKANSIRFRLIRFDSAASRKPVKR